MSIPTIFCNSCSKICFELWDKELPKPKYIPSYKVLYTPYLISNKIHWWKIKFVIINIKIKYEEVHWIVGSYII